jgi:hypothetical protein
VLVLPDILLPPVLLPDILLPPVLLLNTPWSLQLLARLPAPLLLWLIPLLLPMLLCALLLSMLLMPVAPLQRLRLACCLLLHSRAD